MLLAMTVDMATQILRGFLTLSISLLAIWSSQDDAEAPSLKRRERVLSQRILRAACPASSSGVVSSW
jgi:hypothetical protein